MGKVLVVDDHPRIVRLLQIALEKEHEVLTAYNGEDALKIAHDSQPDVMILDVVMPGLDGYRVLHRIKNDPQTQHIVVVMLTVKDQPDDIMLGFTIGADYYIPKPFNAADLASLVRRYMQSRTAPAVGGQMRDE